MNKHEKLESIVDIPDGQVKMIGSLAIPEGGQGLVVFAHGSGSCRHSPRNNYVAKVLRSHGLGTLGLCYWIYLRLAKTGIMKCVLILIYWPAECSPPRNG